MAFTYRDEIGRLLTADEVDANFYEVESKFENVTDMANWDQKGASVDQVPKWTGSEWSPGDIDSNFSYENIQTALTIPLYQQMMVMNELIIENDLTLEGTVICEI